MIWHMNENVYKENKIRILKQYLYSHIHCSITDNSQAMKST